MKLKHWLVTTALAMPMIATVAYADEKNEETHPHQAVKMADLPAAVRATLQREAKGKTIESIKKETENGKTVYEAELVANGKGQEIEISEAGKVIERHAMHEEKDEAEHK